MKKNILAIVAVLAAAMFVNVNRANAQSVEFGSEQRSMTDSASVEMQEIAKIDSMTLDYMEAFASRKHDELMLRTSDGKTYWKGRAIEGFYIGAVGGASYAPTVKSLSYVFGLEAGYTMWWGDFAVTGRVGEVNFDGLTYMAPSAFAEVRVNLAHWGSNKQHRFYLGGRVGYQYSEADNSIELSEENFDFYRKSKLTGSGLGYGLSMGWEVRQFMGGNRFGIQLAAYTYDVQKATSGIVNGEQVVNDNITKQGWQVELTLRYSFQFGKTKRNY